ncbi:hypothetical protein [Massilia genomosp. 1]|uniref:Uncharacterized protein n=1 Tax=Massilia genomosp. 1 TaxID=2609280 RepID=A0ABX0N0Y6_9BURK|nr:hypothetical protein [Massilia genomosp. 1]NHZ66018.1 hypothetical protein [Massilia genomosp. 1]
MRKSAFLADGVVPPLLSVRVTGNMFSNKEDRMNAFQHFAAQHAALHARHVLDEPARRAGRRPPSDIERKTFEHVRAHGGRTVAEIANALGVKSPELYAPLQRLKTLGQIKPNGTSGAITWKAA